MISVLVLSWNAKEEVLACIQSLLQIKTVPLEIIVIDNGSMDGSTAALQALPGITLVCNPENKGYAGGNNQAYQLAKGDYIWLLNQDTIVNQAAAEAMLHWLEEHPDYGGVTTRLENMDGTTQYFMHRRFPRWYNIPLALLYKRWPTLLVNTTRRYLYLDQTFQKDFDLEQAAGSSIMLRKSAITKLGYLFDAERFPLYYNDVDLCRRLYQAGYRIRCLGSVSIQHRKGTSVRKVPRFKNSLIYLKALYHYFGKQ